MELFHEPKMQVFNGMMTAIVQTNGKPGEIVLTASARGLKTAKLVIKAK
jgi:beta-galactosidase